jgi:hypothetical protein
MQDRTAIFTICSNNYLPQAEVFFDSARHHHPEADLFLGLADRPAGDYPPGIHVLPAHDLGIPDFAAMAFRYDIMEFNTAIKPFVMLRLFEQGYTRVLYFDPDIMIFRPLDSVIQALADGASFVLTPHLCSPPGIDALRSEVDIMRTGVYNLGFLACSQQLETEPVLRWWARKLRFECFNDQTGGIFVDQKFMDLVPGFTDHTRVLRDRTMNVAYWNLAQRRIDVVDDTWTVDGRPLGFFHFSGFDATEPHRLSKHASFETIPAALQSLLHHYAERVLAKGHRRSTPYAYDVFRSGTPIPNLVRQMFREKHPTWSGDPFASYEGFLRLPSATAAHGRSGHVVTTLMEFVHERSPDLRSAFDLRNRAHVTAYSRWFSEHAPKLGVSEQLWRAP